MKGAGLVAAALIAVLAVVTVQRAFAVTTAANAVRSTYAIGAGGSSPTFVLASRDATVFFHGATLSPNTIQGVGSISIAYSSFTHLLCWSGTSWGGSAPSSIQPDNTNGNMVFIGNNVTLGHVAVPVGDTPLLVVNNASASPIRVTVEQIW
jgi:hypothetical protein